MIKDVDDAQVAAVIVRVKGEFLEMPGLALTADQAARFWQLDRDLSSAVLARLVAARFLVRIAGSAFARA